MSTTRSRVALATVFVGIVIVTVVAYAPGMSAGFYFDDKSNLVDVTALHWTEFDLDRLLVALEQVTITSRPIANVSLALNHLFAGLDPAPYHWLNLLFHLAVGLALYWMIRTFQRCHWQAGGNEWIALLAVGLFLLHPLNIQAVTYVVQRMTSLATLFILLGLGSYVTGRHHEGQRRAAWLGATVLFFLLALGNKEVAYLLPPLLALYELCFHHAQWRSWFGERFSTMPTTLARAGAGLAILLATLLFWQLFGGNVYWLEVMPTRDFSGYERVLTQGRVQFFYLSLLLLPLPSRLNLDHEFLVSRSLLDPATTLLALIGILVIAVLAIRAIPSRPRVAFPVLAYLLLHSMESAPINLEIVFEHRMYLPMTMLALLLALNIRPSITRFAGAGYAVLLFVAALLATATFQRNHVWGDPVAFLTDCAEKSPNKFRPQYNLGTTLGQMGRLYAARIALERALSLDPEHSEAHNQLGNVYWIGNRQQVAERHYRLAVDLNPENAEALFNLAGVLQSQRRFAEQREVLERFVLHAPPYLESEKQWAIGYLRQ
jgi:tetratricopeptide (TPR) repeat protein